MTSLLEKIKAKRVKMEASGRRERPVKLAPGKNTVRILPNWAGEESGDFSHDFGQHFIKDKAGKITAVYVCIRNTFGKPCPVCQALAECASESTDESTLRAIDDSKPSYRVLVNALIPSSDKPKEVQLLELPPSVFEEYLGMFETYMEDDGVNVLDLKEGHNITIDKTGTGRDTRYSMKVGLKPVKIDEGVLTTARNLDKYVSQEYEAGLQKAITAVRTLNGLAAIEGSSGPTLPSPTIESTTDATGSAAPTLDKVEPTVIEGEVEEVKVETEAEAETPPAAKPASEGIDADLDAELDELLNS